MKAYETTSAPVAKSQEDIRRILAKYGADGVSFDEDWKRMLLFVRFKYTIGSHQYKVSFRVPIPKAPETTPNRQLPRSPEQIQKLQEQYERGIWRAVFWAIKSRMESVEFGIESFVEAFLSHFEIKPDIQIGDVFIQKLEEGNLRFLEQG